jgi:hypothetical protein
MAHAVIHGCIMCVRDVALLAWLLVNASGMRAASAQRPALQANHTAVILADSSLLNPHGLPVVQLPFKAAIGSVPVLLLTQAHVNDDER